MKRKVIQLAGKTMVVSLPIKWVQRYNVQKGQEVEIEEKGRELLLKTQGEPEIKRVEFDTRGQSERIIRLVISGFHKKGFDEMELIYDNPKTADLIQELVKDFFIGFVIINQTKTRCVIKSISKDSEMEFDSTLRRAFLVTITMGENILEAFKNKDLASLKTALNLEKTNNQLINFCERLINKTGHINPELASFYYIIAWNLEKVCDDYKYIVEYLLEQKAEKLTFAEDIISYFEESLIYLKDFYSLFYKFDKNELTSFSNRGKALINKGRSLLKSKKGYENVVISLLIAQVTKVTDFISSTIPLQI